MAKARRAGARLWRWRRSPLRRRIDAVEAWIILGAWLCATAGALMAGWLTGAAAERRLEREQTERHTVSAVVKTTKADATVRPVRVSTAWATVRWTGIDGKPRTGRIEVEPDTEAGDRITVWTDARGRLTAEPPSQTESMFEAALSGILVAAGTGCAVLGCARLVRVGLDRRRMRQWAEAWERADRRWGGTTV
nr:hypothetical protein OH837_38815 [Streptomyces canus]